MTLTSVPEAVTEPAAGAEAAPARTTPSRASRLAHGLAFDRIGAVYVWLGIIVLFSLWVPETFPNLATAKQILNANAITALAALSITIPRGSSTSRSRA
jgi:ribose transport system permease protein